MAGNHFHRQLLEDRANRELVNQAVEEHVAGARRLDVAAEEVAEIGAANHPAVRATLAAFPGEVVSVRPRISDPTTEEGGSQ